MNYFNGEGDGTLSPEQIESAEHVRLLYHHNCGLLSEFEFDISLFLCGHYLLHFLLQFYQLPINLIFLPLQLVK